MYARKQTRSTRLLGKKKSLKIKGVSKHFLNKFLIGKNESMAKNYKTRVAHFIKQVRILTHNIVL